MADSLNEVAALARDDGFRQRVRAAMTVTANAVANEAGDLADEAQARRWDAARDMVASWSEDYLDAMAWLVASNPVIRRGSSDGDIQFTVNASFPVLAAAGPTVAAEPPDAPAGAPAPPEGVSQR